MANLHRLDGNEPETGGILFVFDNDLHKAASWRSAVPVDDTLELAKQTGMQPFALPSRRLWTRSHYSTDRR